MPLPTVILLTVSLFAAGMVALGWAMDPAAPSLDAWFLGKLGEGGLWTGLVPFLLAAAFFAWRGDRAGRRKPAADEPGPPQR